MTRYSLEDSLHSDPYDDDGDDWQTLDDVVAEVRRVAALPLDHRDRRPPCGKDCQRVFVATEFDETGEVPGSREIWIATFEADRVVWADQLAPPAG